MADYPFHLSITSSVSPDYGVLQKGRTDSVCILGFADTTAENLSQVYKVSNIDDALATFSGDADNESTLIQGMIEAYVAGCRDLFLYPIAPMSSYVIPAERTSGFWTDLYGWYEDALAILADYDVIDALVPYDADVGEGEFVELFANHNTLIPDSIIRTTYFSYQGDEDNTFTGEDYSTVLVNGLGTFHFPDHFENDYTSGMAASLAGMVSLLEANVPPDNIPILTSYMFSSDFDGVEETLETHKIVGFRKTVGYKRVRDGSLVTTLCYTRASSGSDFSTLYVVHLLQKFLRGMEKLELVGQPAHSAEETLHNYFSNWVKSGYADSIESNFKLERYTLNVGVIITLPQPIGSISTTFVVGPVY